MTTRFAMRGVVRGETNKKRRQTNNKKRSYKGASHALQEFCEYVYREEEE